MSTMLVYLDDEGDDLATTRGFLARRIDDVMSFEKLRAQWKGSRQRLPSLSRFLGHPPLPRGIDPVKTGQLGLDRLDNRLFELLEARSCY